MRYDSDLLYRPPGEWKSYLLQCTIGCSNNQCTFCGMYKEKKFRIRPVADILEDIDMARDYYGPELRRVFLMDGDAIIMKTDELLQILRKLYGRFPALEKVTLYAGPRSTLSKTPEELRTLHEAGLSRAYLGVESGSDRVLQFIHKGCSAQEMLLAGRRLVEAGIDLWSFDRLTETFRDIQTAQGGRSIVIISHQERIISLADEIVLLQAGSVAATGSPAELMPQLGFAARSLDDHGCPLSVPTELHLTEIPTTC